MGGKASRATCHDKEHVNDSFHDTGGHHEVHDYHNDAVVIDAGGARSERLQVGKSMCSFSKVSLGLLSRYSCHGVRHAGILYGPAHVGAVLIVGAWSLNGMVVFFFHGFQLALMLTIVSNLTQLLGGSESQANRDPRCMCALTR